MGNLFTARVGNILTALMGNVLTVGVGKVLDIYTMRKIFHPALWTSLWRQYLRLHRNLHLTALISEYRWINAIT